MKHRTHAADARDLVTGVHRDGDEQLAEALERLRYALLASPYDDEVAAVHLAAMMEVAEPAPAPAVVAATSLSWGQRTRRVLGLTAAKIVIGAGVAVATTGGLAAADQLPDPAQEVVSRVASWVGVDLPAPAVEHMPEEFPGKGRDGFPGKGHRDDVGRPDNPGQQGNRPQDAGETGDDSRDVPDLPSEAPEVADDSVDGDTEAPPSGLPTPSELPTPVQTPVDPPASSRAG